MRKNNTTITFKDFIAIAEGKQVGTIYHFTRFSSIIEMLENGFNLFSHQEYISFTRNYNMIDYEKYKNDLSFDYKIGDKRGIRIAIDGDKLSNKYKIEPFNDLENKVNRQNAEAEERITKRSVSIDCCIKQIDVIGSELQFNEINKLVKEYNIKNNKNIQVKYSKTLNKLKKVK